MSQEDILNFLKKNKNKEFTTNEIAKKVGVNHSTAWISLFSLHKQQLIAKIIIPNRKRGRIKWRII